MTVNGLIVATTPADAEAAETVKTHHAELAGHLKTLTEAMLSAAEGGAGFEAARAAATEFLTDELLPHAAAEEARLYPAAAHTDRARPLIESMIAAHRVIGGLVDHVRTEQSPLRAAAAGHALRVVFEAHLIDENDRILPIVASDPEISLADSLDGMHELIGGHHHAEGGHSCGCGADAEEPVLDVREVPHSIRHATVFGAFDAVPVGSALVLVAPHDPVPLLRQLHDRTSGRISVDYLERGPEAWKLRLTRH
ncbi:hemerythrin HHE cation binding domain-containing protein [Mycolicibacterium flavescens]|uniref:DUF2249 domain-containing protein n=1 Tax=Mycobacterium neumannii TaxID=2048551 RepID=UPI000B93B819|nr:DUF2249 domain-containing protein [Mycobacterium neumannii]VEG40816.1 hemerythrin HHE cation binding domain-containing protein [Mycolicibacterium flavescens]